MSHACICCKIKEHVMLSHIVIYIVKSNILINEQHGFRNKLSPIMLLMNITIDLANTLSKKGHTDIIFLRCLTKYHINFSFLRFTTMVLEITHLLDRRFSF